MSSKGARGWAATSLFGLSAWMACGCGYSHLKTRSTPPEASSTPIIALAGAYPPSSTAADVAKERVATLRVQPRADLVTHVLEALFESFRTRNAAALEPWLEDAIVDLRGESESRTKYAFLLDLQTRLKSTAFEQLEADSIYRPREVEIASIDDLAHGARSRPPAMTRSDIWVRVPIQMTRLGGEVLFGDEIRLLLRRHGDRYRIRGYGEVLPRN